MYQNEWDEVAEHINFNLEVDIDRFRNEVPYEHRVLDFGCGYGRISSILQKLGYANIVGVDSSKSMMERGRCEFPTLALALVSDEALPFLNNSFDAVVVCAVFTCITGQEARVSKINELRRILKPNGLLHMVEFSAESSQLFTSGVGVSMLHSSPQELRELVSAFQLVSEELAITNTMGGNVANRYSIFARK